MKTPYFAFYPQDWLADNKVMMMTHEQKGVYIDMLCHMWNFQDETCSLPNDDLFLCRLLRLKSNQWKKIKAVLLEGNYPVFFTENGKIFNKRLRKEYEIAKEKSRKAAESVKKRYEQENKKNEAELSNPLKNKETDYTNVDQSNNEGNTNASTNVPTNEERPLYEGSTTHNHNHNHSNPPLHSARARELSADELLRIPESATEWEGFFISRYEFKPYAVMKPDAIKLFTEWIKQKIPIEDVVIAVDYANAKLGELPTTPTYYKRFVEEAVKVKNEEPKNATNKRNSGGSKFGYKTAAERQAEYWDHMGGGFKHRGETIEINSKKMD